MINLNVKRIKAIKGETVLEGKVFDMTDDGRYIHIESDVDYHCIDTTTWTVEEVAAEVQKTIEIETLPVAEDEVHSNLKDVKKEIKKLTRYAEESSIQIRIYSYEEDETGHQVEINVGYDESESELFPLNTYSDEKDAIKRAKSLLKTIKGWNLGNVDGDDAEIKEIHQYSL